MSVDYFNETVGVTKSFTVSSTLVDQVHFNENENYAVVDLNDELYLYRGVSADDVAALVRGENGSVGAYYNRHFKTKFGPGEHLGTWDDWEFETVPVNKDTAGTPKGLTTTAGTVYTAPTAETPQYSLGDISVPVSNGVSTKEYSLAEIPSTTGVDAGGENTTTTVYFTLDGVDGKVFEYNASAVDTYDAVDELNDYVSRIGTRGKVRKVVVEFE